MIVSFKQYGKERTGTSYLRALIKKNFEDVPIYHNTFGWKHGYPVDARSWLNSNTKDGVVMSVYKTPEKYRYEDLEPYAEATPIPVINIKDPYAFVYSFKRFAAYRIEWERANVEEWCLDFNRKYYAWLDFSKNKYHTVVRYEDLLKDYKKVVRDISITYGLDLTHGEPVNETRVVKPAFEHLIQYGNQFDSSTYRKKKYLDELPDAVKAIIKDTIDWDLIQRFGYRPL